MGQDQSRSVVICVSPGINGTWDVSEKGYEKPLASFDDKEDAYAYAIDLTRANEGATAMVEDRDGFSPLPSGKDSSRNPDAVEQTRGGVA